MKSKIFLYFLLLFAATGFAQSPSQKVSAIQYYFNNDPGTGVAGNGGIIQLKPRANLDSTFTITLPNTLGNGFNQLYIRARDEQGRWSIIERQSFFIQPPFSFDITAYQYYYDNDPGTGVAGNGAVVEISATSNFNTTLALTIPNTLDQGIHHLYIRVRDSQGKWSIIERQSFYIQPPFSFNITAYQYYYDNDPGTGVAGNGAVVEISATSNFNTTLALTLPNTLDQGIHHLYIRVRDSQGKWSIIERQAFYIQAPFDFKITAYQYYFDNDPGTGVAGNGAVVNITETTDFNTTLAINVPNNLTAGIHHIYIRVKDSHGKWSIIERGSFYIHPMQKTEQVVALEYYFDTDPGTGSATPISITATDNYNETIQFEVPCLDSGRHFLYIRAKDSYGRWSIIERDTIRVLAAAIIVKGNSINIPDGNTTISTTDDTDFGETLPSVPVVKTYTILNTGSLDLKVSEISMSGTNASDFTIGGISLPYTISAKGSTTFTVTFNATTVNSFDATVIIKSSACKNSTYDFAVQAAITCVTPEFTTCSSDITESTSTGICTKDVTYTTTASGTPTPTYTYSFSGVTTGSGSGTGSGSTFNKGITNVSVTATNACGTDLCSFKVTVNDTEDPTISCVSDKTKSTDNGVCTYKVSGTEFDPTAFNDNCSGSNISNDFNNAASLANAILPKGTTTVTWTVTDASNRTKTCSFDVIVKDNEDPTISCVSDKTKSTDNGVCTYKVSGTEFDPTAFNDNCSGSNISNDFNNAASLANAILPKGTTTVTWTVTDASSRTKTCSFDVIVKDEQDPTISCVSDQTKSTDNGICTYKVSGTEFDPTAFDDNCSGSSISNDFNNAASLANAVFPKGTTTVNWTVTDASNRTKTCSFDVIVKDEQDPTISCVSDKTKSTDNGVCTYKVSGTEFDPTAFADNCSGSSISNDFNNAASLANAVFPKGTTTVNWTVTDASNRTKTCSFDVIVKDEQDPTISCVSDKTKSTDNGVCTYKVSGTEFDPTAFADNCSGSSISNDFNNAASLANEVFPKGTTTVTWTVTDASNRTKTCSFDVIVKDEQDPTISCVSDQTKSTDNGICTYKVSGTEFDPTAFDDNCSGSSIKNDFNNAVSLANAVFPKGTTTVTWTVTDASNRTKTCSFDVIVKDEQDPTISCVSDKTKSTDNGICTYKVSGTEFDPTAFDDNCSGSSISNDFNNAASLANAVFPKGTTTVTWTVTDASSRTEICSFDVIVKDEQDPTISCVSDQTKSTDNGVCTYKVSGTEFDPTAFDDNCTGSSIKNDFNNAASLANAIFPKGTTTVAWTVTDASNNTVTCNFDVTVKDNEIPNVITKDISVTLAIGEANITSSSVNDGSSDNCGISTITVSPSSFNCNNLGFNTVTLTVTDVNGNTGTETAVVNVIGANPLVDITVDNKDYCVNGLIELIANSIGGNSFTYEWSTDETTKSIEINESETYSVVVTNDYGCTVEDETTIDYKNPSALAAYTIIATENVDIQNSSEVQSGGVGVLGKKGDIDVKGNSKITGTGTFAKASDVDVESGSTVSTIYEVPLAVTMPNFKYNIYCEDSCNSNYHDDCGSDCNNSSHKHCKKDCREKNHSKKCHSHYHKTCNSGCKNSNHKHCKYNCKEKEHHHCSESNCGDDDHHHCSVHKKKDGKNKDHLTIGSYKNVTLNDSIYGVITVGYNSAVTFTNPSVYLRGLKTSDKDTIKFASNCTKVMICGYLHIGENNVINPAGKAVLMYVEKTTKVEYKSVVNASIYTLKHLHVEGKSNYITKMKGMYIADHVKSLYATWNRNTECGSCDQFNKRTKNYSSDIGGILDLSKISVNVYPNPNKGTFGVDLYSPVEGEYNVIVLDMVGREVFNSGNNAIKGLSYIPVNLSRKSKAQYIVRINLNGKFYIKTIFVDSEEDN